MKRNKSNGYQGRIFRRVQKSVILIIIFTTIATAASVFAVGFLQGNQRVLEKYQRHTEPIADYTERVINIVGFDELDKRSDMQTEEYQYVQNQIDIIRQVSDLQFLYTVRREATGNFVYVIDGQQPGSKDFAQLGDPVHDVLLPPIEEVYRTGRPVHDMRILQTEYGLTYSSYWPLRDEAGTISGVIGMTFNAESMNYFSADEIVRGVLVAALAAGVICLIAIVVFKKLFEPFYRRLAYTDVLTGLDNRTAFELELKRLQGEGNKEALIAVLVFDLNNLKLANDNYGHAAGDDYIRNAAQLIHARFGGAGGCYRIGGDEFSVLSVGTPEDKLEHLLRHEFRQDIEKLLQTLPEHKAGCFSIAYGMRVYDKAVHQGVRDAFEEADNQMYAMKKQMKEDCRNKG